MAQAGATPRFFGDLAAALRGKAAPLTSTQLTARDRELHKQAAAAVSGTRRAQAAPSRKEVHSIESTRAQAAPSRKEVHSIESIRAPNKGASPPILPGGHTQRTKYSPQRASFEQTVSAILTGSDTAAAKAISAYFPSTSEKEARRMVEQASKDPEGTLSSLPDGFLSAVSEAAKKAAEATVDRWQQQQLVDFSRSLSNRQDKRATSKELSAASLVSKEDIKEFMAAPNDEAALDTLHRMFGGSATEIADIMAHVDADPRGALRDVLSSDSTGALRRAIENASRQPGGAQLRSLL